MHFLFCALDIYQFNHISNCKSAFEIWNTLENIYEGSHIKQTRTDVLTHEYELFKMKNNESILEMFSRFIYIVNNLKSLGIMFSNEKLAIKILRSLTMDYKIKATIIEEAKDFSNISLDELVGSLIAYESISWSQIEEENPKSFSFHSQHKEENQGKKKRLKRKHKVRKKVFKEVSHSCIINQDSCFYQNEDALLSTHKNYFDGTKWILIPKINDHGPIDNGYQNHFSF